MEYLVDTHIFLWWLTNDKRLKNSIKDILSNPDNNIFVSVISGWEISIKLYQKKRLILKTTIEECFLKSGFRVLDMQLKHVLYLKELEILHKDPFDRMLIAQAKVEEATLITGDEKIWKYDIPVLKA